MCINIFNCKVIKIQTRSCHVLLQAQVACCFYFIDLYCSFSTTSESDPLVHQLCLLLSLSLNSSCTIAPSRMRVILIVSLLVIFNCYIGYSKSILSETNRKPTIVFADVGEEGIPEGAIPVYAP